MIDSENQAKNLIKYLEVDKLKTLDVNSNYFLINLKNCIVVRASIVLEGITKHLSWSLDYIVNKDLYIVSTNTFVKFGVKEIVYNDSFRLYIFRDIVSYCLQMVIKNCGCGFLLRNARS